MRIGVDGEMSAVFVAFLAEAPWRANFGDTGSCSCDEFVEADNAEVCFDKTVLEAAELEPSVFGT